MPVVYSKNEILTFKNNHKITKIKHAFGQIFFKPPSVVVFLVLNKYSLQDLMTKLITYV